MPDAIPSSPANTKTRARSAVRVAIPAPNIDGLPPRLTRRAAADALRDRLGFYVSPRTLEVWPLTWLHVNGKATSDTRETFAEAQRRMDAAPPIRGGRNAAQQAA